MTKYALLGAALLATALASPVVAQQVISEPGYCAQFYPNANCQNKGPGNPYTGGGYAQHQLAEWQRVHGTLSAPSPSDAQTAFRSTLMNGHRQAAPAGPKSANCCRSKCAF